MIVLKPRFPNLELAVIALIEGQFPALQPTLDGQARVDTEIPENVQTLLPFCRVKNIGGPADEITGYGTIDVDYYDRLYSDAAAMSGDIQQLMLAGPHRVQIAGRVVVLDRVTNPLAPQEVPWADPEVHRFYASYAVSARR